MIGWLQYGLCVLRGRFAPPQDEDGLRMALRTSLILRSGHSPRLEGRTNVTEP